jgi:hypothetical protein
VNNTHKGHHDCQTLLCCPICEKEYDKHWKVVNHIRKEKKLDHQIFLRDNEDELIGEYLKGKEKLHERLLELENIFCGISYEKIMIVVNRFLGSIELEKIRKKRISLTMSKLEKTEEHNKRVSEGVKRAWVEGKFDTEEYREIMRKGYKKRKSIKGKNNPMYGVPCPKGAGRGKGGFREDIGHYVRSSWEANVCRICNLVKRKYEFESTRFYIIIDNEEYSYCPDFYFPDKNFYYEVKGHARSSSQWDCPCEPCVKNRKKVQATIEKYKIKLLLVGRSEYYHLRKKFKSQIPNWEN